MLSSKPPPYLPALVLEARESAGKIEVGLWQKASGGGDYVTRARKKMETIATQIQRSGTPVQVQGAHYQAAMAAQQLAQQQAAAQRHSQSQTAAAAAQTGNPENEQLAATLDLFDRKLQSGGGSHPPQLQSERPASGHAQNHQAQSSTLTLVQNSAQPPVNDPHMNRLVQLVVKKYVDRPEFKTYLSGLPNAEQRQCLVKIAKCAQHALLQYRAHLAGKLSSVSGSNGHKPPLGLGDAALVEHVTGVVMRLMARAGGGGAGASGVGLHHQQLMNAREAENARVAAAREKLDKERREHTTARQVGVSGQASTAHASPGNGDLNNTPSVHEMATYWKRLGDMRGAYLPRARQTLDVLRKKARDSESTTTRTNATRFHTWMETHLIPMLTQTAEKPCPGAKFTLTELAQLDGQMKKLIAHTSGKGAAAQGSGAAGGGFPLGEVRTVKPTGPAVPATSSGVGESSWTSSSSEIGQGGKGTKRKADDTNGNTAKARDPELVAQRQRDDRMRKAKEDAARPSAFVQMFVTARESFGVAGQGDSTHGAPNSVSGFGAPCVPVSLAALKLMTPSKTGAPFVFEKRGEAVSFGFIGAGNELARGALDARVNRSTTSTPSAASVWQTWDLVNT